MIELKNQTDLCLHTQTGFSGGTSGSIKLSSYLEWDYKYPNVVMNMQIQ